MTNTTNPMITLTNTHGTFKVDADVLNLVMVKYAAFDDSALRELAAGRNGHDDRSEAYRSDNRIEVLIMLAEGGNY